MHLTTRPAHPLDTAVWSAAAVLGDEHPLSRVLDRLRARQEQSLAVAAVPVASVGAMVTGVSRAVAAVVAAAVVEVALACGVALLPRSRQERVLQLIIDGRGDFPLDAVERERRRLLEREHRHALARWLDETRAEAALPVHRQPVRRLFSPSVVRAVASDLGDIATLLRSEASASCPYSAEQPSPKQPLDLRGAAQPGIYAKSCTASASCSKPVRTVNGTAVLTKEER